MALDPERLDDVFVAASEILQTVLNVFNESGQTVPARQYVIAGAPAFDCEQLTVSFMSMANGLPDTPTNVQCDNPRNATYIIDLVRKLPQGKGTKSSSPIVPTPEALTAMALIQMRDAKLLADTCEIFIKNNFIPNVGNYTIIVGEASGNYQAISAEISVAV